MRALLILFALVFLAGDAEADPQAGGATPIAPWPEVATDDLHFIRATLRETTRGRQTPRTPGSATGPRGGLTRHSPSPAEDDITDDEALERWILSLTRGETR